MELIILLLAGLLAVILLLRQRQSETLQQQKQPSEEVKPLDEADGKIQSDADACQRTTSESELPKVYLKVEGVRKNRLSQLQLLLEDRIPELRGEVKPIRGRVQNNTVLVEISQAVAARLNLPITIDNDQDKLQISMAPADGQLQKLLDSLTDFNLENTVIIQNIDPDCDTSELETYIENEARLDQAHVNRTKESPSSALLTNLQGQAQVHQVLKNLNNPKRPLKECILSVEKWPEVNQLILTGLGAGISTDVLEAYFRDVEKSGCNTLVDVKMKTRGIAIVTLRGSQDVKGMMEKDIHKTFICPSVALKVYHPKLMPWLELSPQELRVLAHGDDIHPPFDIAITLELYRFLNTHMLLETLELQLDLICAKCELSSVPDKGIITVYPEMGSKGTEECRVAVEEFLAKFHTQYRDVPKESETVRNAILEHMNDIRDNDRVVATLRENRVSMTGHKEDVKMEYDRLDVLITDHTLTANTEKLEMAVLQCINWCQQNALKSKHPKVTFQVREAESTLSVSGEEVLCREFLNEVRALKPNVADAQLQPEAIIFLTASDNGKRLFRKVMTKHPNVGHYVTDSKGCFPSDDISAYAGLKLVTYNDARLAVTVAKEVKECVAVDTVDVPVEFSHTVQQDCWVKARRSMEAKFTAMFKPQIQEYPPVILVACKAESAKAVRAAIEEFVNKECYTEEVITLKEGQYNYMVNRSQDWIQLHVEIKALQKEKQIEFNMPETSNTDCPKMTVKGFTTKVGQVVQRIRHIQSGIKEETISVSKPGLLEYCKSSIGQQHLIGKASTFKAVLVVRTGEEQKKEELTTAQELPHKTVVCANTIGGGKVLIMQGDLTQYTVDILVNAANTDLQHGGGIAGQISRKGGPEIQEESRRYIREHGRLKEGDAVLLHATGRLPCKSIIHTVGPKWTGGQANEEDTISMAVHGSLKLAEADSANYKSIAFPALSTGIFKVPLDVSARGMLAGVRDFFEEIPESALQVVIMLYKEEHIMPFISASEKYLDVKPFTRINNSLVDTNVIEADVVTTRKPPPRPPPPQASPTTIPRDHSDVRAAELTEQKGISAVDKLELQKGALTDYKADVCINTTSTSLKLSRGMVSKSLLAKGGHTLQEMCNKYIEDHGEVPVWDFATTTGGNTPFKFIIHTAGADFKHGNATKDMEKMIIKVMAECDRLKAPSVGFPAIGTGALNFPPNVTARIMVQVVHQYLQGNPNTSMKRVLFVIYQDEVFDAFQNELTALKSASAISSGPVGSLPPSVVSPVHSSSMCTVGQGSMTSSQMPITVLKGILTDAQADVYVNTTNVSLDLSNGAVAQSLLKTGGPALQDECTRYNLTKGDVAVWNIATTGGAGLKCKHVIHTVGGQYDGAASQKGMEKMVAKVMEECDRLNASSVAFPALGTGVLGFPHHIAARILVQAAHQYLQRNPNTSVENVIFLIFQDEALNSFQMEVSALMSVPRATGAQLLPAVSPVDSVHALPTLARSSSISGAVTDAPTHSKALQRRYSSLVSLSSVNRTVLKELHVDKLCIQFIKGDITEECSDCLVNVASPGPKLQDTGLQGSFLKKGGPELQLAYLAATKEKGNLTKGKVIATAGPVGDLKCKLVCHICLPDENKELKGTVKSVLERAEKAQIQTVAFPMTLESGKKAFPIEKVAKYYYKGVASFIKDPYWSLTKVIVIDPDERLAHQFFHAFENASKDRPGLFARGGQAIKKTWTNSRRRSSDATAATVKEQNPSPRPLSSSLALRFEEEGPDIFFTAYASTDTVAKMVTKEVQHFVDTQFKEEVIDDPNVKQLQLQPDTTDKLFSEAERKHVKLSIESCKVVLQGHKHDTEQLKNAVHRELSKIAAARERMTREEAEWKGKQAELRYQQAESEKQQIQEAKRKAERGRLQAEDDSAKKLHELEWIKTHGERPDDWDPMEIDPLTGTEVPYNVMTVDISPGTTEYTNVASHFSASIGASTSLIRGMQMPFRGIIKIQRIQNPMLYNQYIAKKKTMVKMNPSHVENERQLFHGCPGDVVNNINSTGFNRSYCGKNAVAHGLGVYFTSDAQYAARDIYSTPDRSGYKHMYLAKVLTGVYTKGRKGMIEPPSRDQYNEAMNFDSAVDDIHNPQIFVVFFDGQAYPEYLITFH